MVQLKFPVRVMFWTLCMVVGILVLVSSHWQTQHILLQNVEPSLRPAMPSPPRPAVKRLAVIFTTFSDSPQKAQLFSNAVNNWATFMPSIQPVLFATDMNASLVATAVSHGWLVAPCPRVNDYGTPFLEDMYLAAYRMDKAHFYGFVNGDILFDASLVNTMHRLVVDLCYLNATLVTGRRWSYRLHNDSTFEAWTPHDVMRLANSNTSTLDRMDTEDYFLVTQDYPWHAIKDVVIGRPAYDNYLVARSIQLNVTTIDATKTVTALHQRGHYNDRALRPDGGINKKMIGPFNYYAGLTNKMWLRTMYDYKGEVFVEKQTITNHFLNAYKAKFQTSVLTFKDA